MGTRSSRIRNFHLCFFSFLKIFTPIVHSRVDDDGSVDYLVKIAPRPALTPQKLGFCLKWSKSAKIGQKRLGGCRFSDPMDSRGGKENRNRNSKFKTNSFESDSKSVFLSLLSTGAEIRCCLGFVLAVFGCVLISNFDSSHLITNSFDSIRCFGFTARWPPHGVPASIWLLACSTLVERSVRCSCVSTGNP